MSDLVNYLLELEKFSNQPYVKLNKVVQAREERYSNSPYAGVCWLLEEVLGIDPYTVALEDFDVTAYGYKTFMFDTNGKKIYHNNISQKLTVPWTAEQKRLIAQWWEYIPPEFRGDND